MARTLISLEAATGRYSEDKKIEITILFDLLYQLRLLIRYSYDPSFSRECIFNHIATVVYSGKY